MIDIAAIIILSATVFGLVLELHRRRSAIDRLTDNLIAQEKDWTEHSLRASRAHSEELQSTRNHSSKILGEYVKHSEERIQELNLTIETKDARIQELTELWNAQLRQAQLAAMVAPTIRQLEPQARSGEWKFHEAYSLLQKDSGFSGYKKWQLGLAIHQAVAALRDEAYKLDA